MYICAQFLKTMQQGEFESRHIGPRKADLDAMLATIGVGSLDELIRLTVPAGIRPLMLSRNDFARSVLCGLSTL